MTKKLWFLNLLLIAGIVLIAREWQASRRAAEERRKSTMAKAVKPAPAPQMPPAAVPQPIAPAGYIDVAQGMLFSKDRNPTIVVEAPPVKPLPPFPKFFGVMNLGDGAMAILSDGPGRQRPYQVGEKTGEFKLAAIGEEHLVFEWEGKEYKKRFGELVERGETSQETTRAAAPAPAAAPPPAPAVPVKAGPGTDIGAGVRACVAGDTTPAGSVVDGMKKIVTETPFSKVCRWEPVK